MNILLIGGSGSLINNMITKLNKEGHRVYLLTGNKYQSGHYQKVFEKYNFPYNSNCLNEIFESINPDVTVFMGAFDTNFSWKNEESEAVRYSSSVMNILMAYVMTNQGRFIYLSSEEVFQGDYPEKITENTPKNPQGYKSMVLSQVEEMCESYQKNCERDIMILRLDHLFFIPQNPEDATDICSRMCLSAMSKYTISADENNTFSMIYVSDAIDYLYRVITCKKHRNNLYHISTERAVSERQLAEYIRKYAWFDIEIAATGKKSRTRILSGKLFETEFGTRYLCDNEEMVRSVVEHMKKNRNFFMLYEKNKESTLRRVMEKGRSIFKSLFPFVENLVTFLIFFVINNRITGSSYFADLNLYLIYVLLFAMVYGQQQATFSAILAVLGYLFRQTYDRTGFEVMLDSNTYIWIAQLFILGLPVGYLRDFITKLQREQETEKEFLSVQLQDIKDINDSNVRVKDALETEIINQNDSIGKIYRITKTLDRYSQEEVLFYAAEMIGELVKSKDVAVYTVSGDTFARLFSATSEKARSMGNSIRYKEMGEMYQDFVDRKVYINRKLDDAYPLMANGIADASGQLQMIVMIWSIPWENMTLGQANQLTVICSLIQNAVIRANRYLEALEKERYVNGSKLLETEAFGALVEAYLKAEKKGLTNATLLRILSADTQDGEQVGQKVSALLRDQDYVGCLSDGSLAILLSNTREEDAMVVIERLNKIHIVSEIVEGL